MSDRFTLRNAKRVTIKVGSALLIDPEAGLRHRWLDSVADDIRALRDGGADVLVVSSGAVALGRARLGLPARPLRLEEKQAAAAAGQTRLAQAWEEALARQGLIAAQALLTLSDTEERRRHLNARDTLHQLLKLGAIPIINENDTMTTSALRYGDNDRLAARIAVMIAADALVLLSDVDGLYSADPRRDPAARLLPEVRALTPEILAMAGDAPPGVSSGGMRTKLEAARIAVGGGCPMAIACGVEPHPLRRLAMGGPHTWFYTALPATTAWKRWIAAALRPAGTVTVDAGAETALRRGYSLLPAGVTALDGDFHRGDPVVVRGSDGRRLGVGLTAYDAIDAQRIIGLRSAAIAGVLGYEGRAEMIHRDDLALEPARDDGLEQEEKPVPPYRHKATCLVPWSCGFCFE